MPRIALLCNPKSKRNQTLMPDLIEASRRHELEWFSLEHLEELPNIMAELSQKEITHLIINGGDGTVQTVLTALIRRGEWRPHILLLGGGMTNIIAHDMGEKREPRQGLYGTLAAIREKKPPISESRNLIKIDMPGTGTLPHYCFLIGGMSFYAATMSSRRNVHRLGVGQMLAANMSIFWSVLNAIAGRTGKGGILVGEEVSIGIDREAATRKNLALFLATTLNRLLPIANPFWGRGEGAIKATTISYPPIQLWRAAIPLLRGRPSAWMQYNGYSSFRADEIRLDCNSPFIMDGETLISGGGNLKLSTGPKIEFSRYE